MKKEAVEVVKKLQLNGFTAYFAGGAVRDILRREDPQDIDIATSAKPEEVKQIFLQTHPLGIDYGTLLVVFSGKKFEVTTFRTEAEYKDQRRPSSVTFSSAREDANRRDFTINAIFYDPIKNSFIDYVGGIEDIKKGVVRFVGNPEERISEDHLRLMRAIRFKITLGYQYSKDTFDAVRKNAGKIKSVAAERIRDELNKILTSPNRHLGIIELSESTLLSQIIPELELLKGVPQPEEYHHEGDCFTHTYLALKSLPRQASLRLTWAVLLHDIAKPLTRGKRDGIITFDNHATKSAELTRVILIRLKFPKVEIDEICWLVHYHMSITQIDQMRPSKRFSFLTDAKFDDLIKLVEADSKGTYPINLELVEKIQREKENAIKKANLHTNPQIKRLVNGNDLIELGIEPREKYAEILDTVFDQQLEGKIQSKDEAIKFLESSYK